MGRYIVAAALVLQATLHAQDGNAPIPNPFVNDPFWSFHVGSVRYEQMVEKAKSSIDPVDAIEANFVIGSKSGAVRAARGLLVAPPAEFARGVRMLIEHSHDLNDDGTGINREFLEFIGEARKRAESFSGENGADAASAMLTLEYIADRANDAAHQQRVQAFRTRFAGTRAAEAMRVSQVDASRMSRDIPEWMRRYRELARDYDGTETGAMAWYYLGSRQANCCHGGSEDEVERLIEVFDIVKQLESGRFPRSEWVDRAPSLIGEFFFGSTAQIPAAVMPRLYASYLEFVLAHPIIKAQTSGGGVEWIVRNAVSRLAPTPIDRVAIVERFLDDLEKRGFGVNEVRVLRAKFYFSLTDPGWIADHMKGGLDLKEADARAIRTLRTMIDSAQPAEVVRAHGMLAAHYFASGRYAEASAHLTALQTRYPDADWNWVAALRIAQINERLGQKTAAADYEAVALRPGLSPAAVLLSRISAAELREQSGALPAAAAHYREALNAWQSLPGPLHIFWTVAAQDGGLPVFRRFADLKKADVLTRLDRLSKTVTTDEALLYEGRRALELDKPREALVPLTRLVESYPKSGAAVEGRLLLRRARFESALTADGAPARRSPIDRELKSLAAEKFDPIVAAARLAQAAMMVRQGRTRDAEVLTRTTLERWHAAQPAVAAPQSAIDRDVAAIRAALFLPRGGGVFGKRGWNAFEWPDKTEPFIVVARDVIVKTADGREAPRPATFSAPAGDRVLFLTRDDFRALNLILDRIGGTETAEWVNATDLPNQPIGGAPEIAAMWARFFHVRPGHWGGWELTTYPDISRITFDREGHALADFTIGYSGGSVELEKEKGVWVAKRMVSMWIT